MMGSMGMKNLSLGSRVLSPGCNSSAIPRKERKTLALWGHGLEPPVCEKSASWESSFEDMSFEDVSFEDGSFEDVSFEDVSFEDMSFEDMSFEDMSFEDMSFEDIVDDEPFQLSNASVDDGAVVFAPAEILETEPGRSSAPDGSAACASADDIMDLISSVDETQAEVEKGNRGGAIKVCSRDRSAVQDLHTETYVSSLRSTTKCARAPVQKPLAAGGGRRGRGRGRRTSIYRGVSRTANGKWGAKYSGRRINGSSSCATEEDAARAYDAYVMNHVPKKHRKFRNFCCDCGKFCNGLNLASLSSLCRCYKRASTNPSPKTVERATKGCEPAPVIKQEVRDKNKCPHTATHSSNSCATRKRKMNLPCIVPVKKDGVNIFQVPIDSVTVPLFNIDSNIHLTEMRGPRCYSGTCCTPHHIHLIIEGMEIACHSV